MRVIGLTASSSRINEYFGASAIPIERQIRSVRDWAAEHSHEVIGIYEIQAPWTTQRIVDAHDAGAISAFTIPTERLVDYAELSPSWPYWLSSGFRTKDRLGRNRYTDLTIFATDTGERIKDVKLRQKAALDALEKKFSQIPADMSRRMQAARRKKHDAGGYAYGAPPFGWTSAWGSLVPEAREQRVLQRALALRTEGHTLRAICSTLNDEGHLTRRRSKWNSGTLSRILNRVDPPASQVDTSLGSVVRMTEMKCDGRRVDLCTHQDWCKRDPVSIYFNDCQRI